MTVDLVIVGLGALGSATGWQAARRGARVVGLEQFELGHDRGASHDTSRILRRSYHAPEYVRLAGQAYDDWADLSRTAGDDLVTTTGGVDLFPPGAAIDATSYTTSMDAAGVPYEVLEATDATRRWPRLRPPAGTVVLHQVETSIVPAGRGTAVMQRLARAAGAELRDRCRVRAVEPHGDGVRVVLDDGSALAARRAVVTADAWAAGLVEPLGVRLPLTVTQEQVTYVRPDDAAAFAPGAFPVWIWMDDPSFYGFPTYGEPLVKAAQDCGGPVVTADDRSFAVDPERERLLLDFLHRTTSGLGAAVRSRSCLYSLTPDREFVLDAVPGAPQVVVGLGAAHGFKFAPTFGRLLADLALDDRRDPDTAGFRLDRPALADPAVRDVWLV